MTIKGTLKAVGKALLYFLVYFSWQLMIVNWAAIGISMYLTFTQAFTPDLDIGEMTAQEYAAYAEELTVELTEKTYEIIAENALLLTLISGGMTLLTYFVIFKIRRKRFRTEISLAPIQVGQGINLFALGLSLNVFVSLAMMLIPFPETWMEDYIESSSMVLGGGVLITWLTTVIAAPIVEEIVFRGLCYTRLKKGMPMLAAMLISAWGFGLMHGTVIWFLYASVFGFLLVWIFEKHRSLTAGIIVHLGFNLMGQLSAYVNEIPDTVFWLLLAASGIASAALLIHIQRTSPHKIELVMATPDEPHNERNSQ